MESKPRTSTTQETILRIKTARSNTWMTAGIFRFNGQGVGELRLSDENWMDFPMFRMASPDSTPGDRAKSLPNEAHCPHAIGFHPALLLFLIDRMQTQNA
jgi:hypothetical protein